MTLFVWDDIYSVGNKHIDAQHRRLFDIANRFHEAFQARAGRGYLLLIFEELLDYTASHFADEEQLMRQSGYPDFARHKVSHDKLVVLVSTYKRQLEVGVEGTEARIAEFVKMWLNGHILGMDRNIKPYVAAPGTG